MRLSGDDGKILKGEMALTKTKPTAGEIIS
jgi:hypothetical protein